MLRYKYKLITFDITGTILKGRKTVGEIYTKAGESFGITGIHSDTITTNFQKEWIKMCKAHPNFGLYSRLGWESWWKNIVKSTFIKSSREQLSDDSLNGLSSHLIELYSTKNGWLCEKGAVELLQYLVSNKIVVGVISNFDTRLHSILLDLGLNNFFSFVLTSYETTYLKPDVRIFEIAKKCYKNKTGFNLEESDALHVGNSEEHDVEGARAAGWNSALISNKGHLKGEIQSKNVMVFKNLPELHNHLVFKSKLGF